jgi:hypothetical protein
MSQPTWKLIANLGDMNPIDYGGYFVYVDETGVYQPEAELLIAPEEEDSGEPWMVYRFVLERCTCIDGILSDNPFHRDHPVWFAKPETERADRPQDTTYLSNVADFIGQPVSELIAGLCSEDPIARARVYRAIGDYHGFENLDSYPLTYRDRAKVEARYAQAV